MGRFGGIQICPRNTPPNPAMRVPWILTTRLCKLRDCHSEPQIASKALIVLLS